MREDFPHGRVTSRSMKSTVFHSHDGEWKVSKAYLLKCSSILLTAVTTCGCIAMMQLFQSDTAASLENRLSMPSAFNARMLPL